MAGIFLFFGLTDFLDGYLARRYQRETTLGRLLDPLADKCLLYATLVALVAVDKLYFFWAIIMIGREFFVMSLREIALVYNFSVPVGYWGKIKTVVQIICLAFIILNPYHYNDNFSAIVMNSIESILLMLAIIITLYSAYYYFRQFSRNWYVITSR